MRTGCEVVPPRLCAVADSTVSKEKGKTALIVVKDRESSRGIVARLGSTGYEAVVHVDPATAVDAAMSARFDLCLLQMGKEKPSGTEIAFDLRRAGFSSPIVGFVSSQDVDDFGQIVVWSAGPSRLAEIQRLMKVLCSGGEEPQA